MRRFAFSRCFRSALGIVIFVTLGAQQAFGNISKDIELVRFRFFHFLRERGNDLKEVADDPEVRHAEDRFLGILINGDDVLRGRHPGEMLDGARNAGRMMRPAMISYGADGSAQ